MTAAGLTVLERERVDELFDALARRGYTVGLTAARRLGGVEHEGDPLVP